MLRQLEVIGAAWGLGGADPGCAEAPDTLGPLAIERLARCGAHVRAGPVIRPRTADRRKSAVVARLCGELAAAVAGALAHDRVPCVIGGDHSCAGGTWSGVARHFHAHGPLGLLWIDAHMDSHTPRTSHTGRLHGMPLAWLLGEDDDPLYGLSTGVLDPRHVCLVGVRSFEPEEDERLRRLGVRVILSGELERRGVDAALAEALEIATRGTRAYGVSIDLDVVAPDDAPGVGTPVPGGPSAQALARGLVRVALTPGLAALELVEYSPRRDPSRRTAQAALDLLAAALCGRGPGEDPQVLADAVHRHDP